MCSNRALYIVPIIVDLAAVYDCVMFQSVLLDCEIDIAFVQLVLTFERTLLLIRVSLDLL